MCVLQFSDGKIDIINSKNKIFLKKSHFSSFSGVSGADFFVFKLFIAL